MRRSAMLRAGLGGVIGAAVIIGIVAAVAGAQTATVERTSAARSTPSIERDAEQIAEGALDARRLHQTTSPPSTTPTQVELEAADAAGEADDATVPIDAAPDPAPAPESNGTGDASFTSEQTEWLAFQQVVRDCMAGVGQEYLYWEWWSGVGTPGGMPTQLVDEARVAWELALYGDSPGGADYRWEDAGCWGYTAELLGTSN
jgi:hypothetical protein